MDENQIIRRCREGDREAFERLVIQHQSGVLSLAWGILRNREEAEDAAQETFVRAFSRLGGFDLARSFRAWLYAIAYHGCLDRLKRRQSENRFRSSLDPAGFPIAGGAGPEKRVEDAEALSPLLDRLNAKERLALFLAAVEGFTMAEIAAALGCSEGSARVRVHNVKKKIRKWLERSSDVES
jgi:RNA polymerase sigma-70 factor (ECF subfamily)